MEKYRPEAVDRYKFVGLSGENIKKTTQMEAFLDARHNHFYKEIEHTEEMENKFNKMQTAIIEFGRKELKIDLTNKFVNFEKCHFFDEESWQEISKDRKFNFNSVNGFMMHKGDIFLKKYEYEPKTLHIIGHELIHCFSHRIINVGQESGTIFIVLLRRCGFQDGDSLVFSGFDEAITEITNMEIIKKYWVDKKLVEPLEVCSLGSGGYGCLTLTVEGLLKKVTREQKRNYEEVLKKIQRDKFLGRYESLRMITESIGVEGIREMSKLENTKESCLKFIRNARLDEI